ncbi:hypothetical protein ACSAZL_10035 [Methanosarcina sp. T3]|uniref:hypothetical protein n=1 Tax=Methanosarcina sp. T3 TaxID=3439062 RepID=UPI003F8496FA
MKPLYFRYDSLPITSPELSSQLPHFLPCRKSTVCFHEPVETLKDLIAEDARDVSLTLAAVMRFSGAPVKDRNVKGTAMKTGI